mgnify:CR=1 FL=1
MRRALLLYAKLQQIFRTIPILPIIITRQNTDIINQHIKLDPYILGLWLGDGYSNGKEFCTNDKEILDIWYNWCEDNNALIVKRKDNFRYYIKNKDNQQDSGKHYPYKNPLKSKL